MPISRPNLSAGYEMGACVLYGDLGNEKNDPAAARVVFTELNIDSWFERGHWRVPVTSDLPQKLEQSLPGITMSKDLLQRIAMTQHRDKALASAASFVAAPIEKQKSWLQKQGLLLKMSEIGAHQVTSIGFALILGCSALFLDTGLGKTYVGIGFCDVQRKRLLALGKRFRALIVAPKTLLREAWGGDIGKFSDMTWEDIGDPKPAPREGQCPLCSRRWGDGKNVSTTHLKTHLAPVAEKLTPANPDKDAYKNAFDFQVKALLEELYRQHPHIKAAGKDERIDSMAWQLKNSRADIFLVNPEQVHGRGAELLQAEDWDVIIIDESTMLRSPTSRITGEMLKLGEKAERKIVMTATPRPNSSAEYWGQMSFVDWCLGASYARFKSKYFEEDRQGQRFWAKPGADIAISDIVAKRSLRYRQRDCLDLPEEVTETVEVVMGPEQKKAYAEMVEEMSATVYETVDGKKVPVEVSVNMKIAQMMKLAQIGSGFIYSRDSDEPIIIENNPRINETVRLCQQFVQQERQVVVWVRFRKSEGAIIKKRLEALGIGVSTVWGEMSSDDVSKSVAAFKSGKHAIMLANAKSAAFGHTWTQATAMIFHSYDYSWEQYYQSRKRIMRFGQKHPCTYVNIVCRGSIDKQIMKALVEKGSASAIVVDRDFMANVRNEFEAA